MVVEVILSRPPAPPPDKAPLQPAPLYSPRLPPLTWKAPVPAKLPVLIRMLPPEPPPPPALHHEPVLTQSFPLARIVPLLVSVPETVIAIAPPPAPPATLQEPPPLPKYGLVASSRETLSYAAPPPPPGLAPPPPSPPPPPPQARRPRGAPRAPPHWHRRYSLSRSWC